MERISDFVSAECLFHDVSGKTRLRGTEELTSNLRQWFEVFEDPHVEVRRVLQDQSSPTIGWDWILSVKPMISRNDLDQRTRVNIYGITFATISDGKIVEEVNCTDMKEFIDLVEGRRE